MNFVGNISLMASGSYSGNSILQNNSKLWAGNRHTKFCHPLIKVTASYNTVVTAAFIHLFFLQ